MAPSPESVSAAAVATITFILPHGKCSAAVGGLLEERICARRHEKKKKTSLKNTVATAQQRV